MGIDTVTIRSVYKLIVFFRQAFEQFNTGHRLGVILHKNACSCSE